MIEFDSVNSENLLFLDVGNTAIKGAYKEKSQWDGFPSGTVKTVLDLVEWMENHATKFEGIVLSSVRNDITEAILQEIDSIPIYLLETSNIPPEMLDYKTPATLGIDRFLACLGAAKLTNKAVVVIDAGTAITIDFMSADDVYRGGIIAPGYTSFSGILAQKAPALPIVDDSIPESWPGKSTRDSLRWGKAGFYKIAIEGVLQKYKTAFGDFDLFITGGDAAVIENMLDWEAKIRPFLVFEGMEMLLDVRRKT